MLRLALFLFALVLSAIPAAAQTVAPPINPLLEVGRDYAVGLLQIAMPVVLAWFAYKVNQWFGLKKDAELRDALQTSLDNATGKMIQHTGAAAKALLIGSAQRNQALAAGLKYVQDSAPDAIKHFGLSDGSIIEKLEAKLGLKMAESPKG